MLESHSSLPYAQASVPGSHWATKIKNEHTTAPAQTLSRKCATAICADLYLCSYTAKQSSSHPKLPLF